MAHRAQIMLASGAPVIGDVIDADQIGLVDPSFSGWIVLKMPDLGAFGHDEAGELYLLTTESIGSTDEKGNIHKLVPVEAAKL